MVLAAAIPTSRWAFGGRLLVNLGNALGTTYLLYFLQDDLKLADPDTGLLVLTLVYLVFTLLATVLGGRASDRSGRRRSFVAVAGFLQAIASLLLTAFPRFGVALVAAAFLGAGYGAYMSVDQALVTAVLPDRRHPRQGPRHHERRLGRAAGARPAGRQPDHQRTRRLPGAVRDIRRDDRPGRAVRVPNPLGALIVADPARPAWVSGCA